MMQRTGIAFLMFAALLLAGTARAEPDAGEFFRLVASNDVEGARKAIEEGQDVNVRDAMEQTPLLRALSSHLRPEVPDDFYKDIVIEGDSFRSGSPETPEPDLEMAALLIAAGADVNAVDKVGTTPLHRAAGIGPEAVRLLLAASADVDIRDGGGMTPLLPASILTRRADPAKRLAAVEALLKAGADPNAHDGSGKTPLLMVGALAQGYFPRAEAMLMKLMLDAGADPDARDDVGDSVLSSWASSPPEVVKMLLDAGADPNARNDLGTTPLISAALFTARPYGGEVLELLLKAGADVNAQAKDGETALFMSAVKGNAGNVEILLKAGADPNRRTDGLTPLHAAAGIIAVPNADNKGTFEQRLEYGLGMFRSSLQPKPAPDFIGTLRLLVEAGAELDARSTEPDITNNPETLKAMKPFIGKTALDFARMLGNKQAEAYLKSVGAKSARKWYWPF